MKFCQSHWDELRKAIDDVGLGRFVHRSGEAVAEAQVRQIEGTARARDYDPLMSAHWNIVNHALGAVGLGLMYGDLCPLCECRRQLGEHIKVCNEVGCNAASNLEDLAHWIDHAVQAELRGARERGLVPPVA